MFQPTTIEELEDAVDFWCDNEPEALEKYGDINTWDVSKITDMSELFMDKENFNSDISNWDVSNVKDYTRIFQDSNCMKEEWKPKFN